MKKTITRYIIACLLLAMVSACTAGVYHQPQTAQAAGKKATKAKALKAYKRLLGNEKRLGKYTIGLTSQEFAIIDMNRDGVPEIVVTGDEKYHSQILAYVNGKIKSVGGGFAGGDEDGGLTFYPNKRMYLRETTHSSQDEFYYKFNGKKMKEVVGKTTDDFLNWNDESKCTHTINGKKVSSQKYKKYKKKILKGAKKKKLKWHINTSANRNKYLKAK